MYSNGSASYLFSSYPKIDFSLYSNFFAKIIRKHPKLYMIFLLKECSILGLKWYTFVLNNGILTEFCLAQQMASEF
jgi:hypothetical protein